MLFTIEECRLHAFHLTPRSHLNLLGEFTFMNVLFEMCIIYPLHHQSSEEARKL